MTVDELKARVYGRAAEYWGSATVVWGSANKVRPGAPLVMLRLGTVTRTAQPVNQLINGIVFSAYPSEAALQVDLFTKGKAVTVNETAGAYSENTAVNDLLGFVNFIEGAASVEWSGGQDVSVRLIGGVRDLSEVINDSQWQYRAMAELAVSFTQWAAEYNGILGEYSIIFDDSGSPVDVNREEWRQTASGGGTQELADESTGFFEKVLIDYWKRRQ